ncbi:MAG: hypothetical protein HYY46_26295 [Deltaproteobacteria bacterium]|nr:hypothetical protein [Deltaproteobacteria bacterium]
MKRWRDVSLNTLGLSLARFMAGTARHIFDSDFVDITKQRVCPRGLFWWI